MRWFVRGDIDGFFGLALDNLVQLLLIGALCSGVLGFDAELLYGTVLPGVAVSLLVGNLYYGWQARELGIVSRRRDVCALPYGVNTVSLLAHVFLVMLPAKMEAIHRGASPELASYVAWRAGLVACFGCGLIELLGAFFANVLKRITPRAALLSTLAGIAVAFIAMSFLFRTYARPLIGLSTLAIILTTYFGGLRFRGGIPGGFVAVGLGTATAWLTGLAPATGVVPLAPQIHLPIPVLGDLIQGIFRDNAFVKYLPVILPMGLFNLIGSLQNIESAEAAGDRYPVFPSLCVNGLGSMAAATFGSCFPTTIYIGHPGWKALGARAGYSILNALFFAAICFFGLLSAIEFAIPIDAGMAIILFIGIVIAAQAFQATPARHAPAVVVGLLPGIGAWGTLMATQALQVAGFGAIGGPRFDQKLLPSFEQQGVFIDGAFALSEGFILTAMILSATTVAIIENNFYRASAWCIVASILSAIGLMHSFKYAGAGATMDLFRPAWPWAAGYLAMAVFLLLAPSVTEPAGGHGATPPE